MRIKLDDVFTLNSDRYCFWISKKNVRKKGKNVGTEDINTGAYDGYHNNIPDCFESFFLLRQKLAEPRKRKIKKGDPATEKASQTRKEDKLDAQRIAAIEEDMTVQELIKISKDAKKEIKGWCKEINESIKLIKTDKEDKLL